MRSDQPGTCQQSAPSPCPTTLFFDISAADGKGMHDDSSTMSPSSVVSASSCLESPPRYAPDATNFSDEEELTALVQHEKVKDPLLHTRIRRTLSGRVFDGVIEDIEVGQSSRQRLYRMKYCDGDLEHFTAQQVHALKVTLPPGGG